MLQRESVSLNSRGLVLFSLQVRSWRGSHLHIASCLVLCHFGPLVFLLFLEAEVVAIILEHRLVLCSLLMLPVVHCHHVAFQEVALCQFCRLVQLALLI